MWGGDWEETKSMFPNVQNRISRLGLIDSSTCEDFFIVIIFIKTLEFPQV